MPVGPLEARCERTFEEISTILQRIRRSALLYGRNQARNQSFNIAEKLRRQMETIRISCDAMLEAITLENYTTDDRITDWLLSGEPRSWLGKLKEMDDMLKSDGQVHALARSLTSTEDKLAAVVTLFDKHSNLFHCLLTPGVW